MQLAGGGSNDLFYRLYIKTIRNVDKFGFVVVVLTQQLEASEWNFFFF